MSKLSNLRDALVKLEAAEDALFHTRQSFRESPSYSRLDHQYEIVGDAVSIIRDILGIEERKVAYEAQEPYEGACEESGGSGDNHTDPDRVSSDCPVCGGTGKA